MLLIAHFLIIQYQVHSSFRFFNSLIRLRWYANREMQKGTSCSGSKEEVCNGISNLDRFEWWSVDVVSWFSKVMEWLQKRRSSTGSIWTCLGQFRRWYRRTCAWDWGKEGVASPADFWSNVWQIWASQDTYADNVSNANIVHFIDPVNKPWSWRLFPYKGKHRKSCVASRTFSIRILHFVVWIL